MKRVRGGVPRQRISDISFADFMEIILQPTFESVGWTMYNRGWHSQVVYKALEKWDKYLRRRGYRLGVGCSLMTPWLERTDPYAPITPSEARRGKRDLC